LQLRSKNTELLNKTILFVKNKLHVTFRPSSQDPHQTYTSECMSDEDLG